MRIVLGVLPLADWPTRSARNVERDRETWMAAAREIAQQNPLKVHPAASTNGPAAERAARQPSAPPVLPVGWRSDHW